LYLLIGLLTIGTTAFMLLRFHSFRIPQFTANAKVRKSG